MSYLSRSLVLLIGTIAFFVALSECGSVYPNGNSCTGCQYIDTEWVWQGKIYYQNWDEDEFRYFHYFTPDHKNGSWWEDYGYTACNDLPFDQNGINTESGRQVCREACLANVPEAIHLFRFEKSYTSQYYYTEKSYLRVSYVPSSAGWSDYCNYRYADSSADIQYPFLFPAATESSRRWIDTNGYVSKVDNFRIIRDEGCTMRFITVASASECLWNEPRHDWPSSYYCYGENLNSGYKYYTSTNFGCKSNGCDSHSETQIDEEDFLFFSSRRAVASSRQVPAENGIDTDNTDGCWYRKSNQLRVPNASPFRGFVY